MYVHGSSCVCVCAYVCVYVHVCVCVCVSCVYFKLFKSIHLSFIELYFFHFRVMRVLKMTEIMTVENTVTC